MARTKSSARRLIRSVVVRNRRQRLIEAQPPEKRCWKCVTPPSTWIPAQSPKPYLTTIPPEIRKNILELLLLNNGPIKADYLTTREKVFVYRSLRAEWQKEFDPLPGEWSRGPTIDDNLAVLAMTCSQLYYEAISIYYGRNNFQFNDVLGMYDFLDIIGATRRTFVGDVTFLLTKVPSYSHAFRLLQQCRLRKLKIGVMEQTVNDHYKPRNQLLNARGTPELRKIGRWRDLDLKVLEVTGWVANRLEWELLGDHVEVDRRRFDLGHLKEFERVLREDFRREKEEEVAERVLRQTRARTGRPDERKEGKDMAKRKGNEGKNEIEIGKKPWKYVSRKTRQVAEREEKGCECLYR